MRDFILNLDIFRIGNERTIYNLFRESLTRFGRTIDKFYPVFCIFYEILEDFLVLIRTAMQR